MKAMTAWAVKALPADQYALRQGILQYLEGYAHP